MLDASFLPLFNRIMMSDTKSLTCLRAIHLRLQYLASYVIEDPAHYLDVEVLRSQTPFTTNSYLSLKLPYALPDKRSGTRPITYRYSAV